MMVLLGGFKVTVTFTHRGLRQVPVTCVLDEENAKILKAIKGVL